VDIVPLVAAHQHFMIPAGVALVPPEPPLATITLPPDLGQLLRRRKKVSGAPPTGDLFTEDAIIQELQEGRWQKGCASCHSRTPSCGCWHPTFRLT
jgi:hypothetical protein